MLSDTSGSSRMQIDANINICFGGFVTWSIWDTGMKWIGLWIGLCISYAYIYSHGCLSQRLTRKGGFCSTLGLGRRAALNVPPVRSWWPGSSGSNVGIDY